MGRKYSWVLLCAVVLIGFCPPAIADSLGNKIADKVCGGNVLHPYTLTADEEAVWNNAHDGRAEASNLVGQKIHYYFRKSANASGGECKAQVGSNVTYADVVKDGRNVSNTGFRTKPKASW